MKVVVVIGKVSVGLQLRAVEDDGIVRAAQVGPSLRGIHHVQYPGLRVDGFLGVGGQCAGGNDSVDVGIRLGIRDFVALQIVVVQPPDGSLHTGLEVVFHRACHVPAFKFGFSQQQFHLG